MRLWHIIPTTFAVLGLILFAPVPGWLTTVLVIALGSFVMTTVLVVFGREGTRTLERHEWPA